MKIITSYLVPSGHPVLAGHFPGQPMVPGAMLLDALLLSVAQSYGLCPGACEFHTVKFLSPAVPGDELEFRHEKGATGVIRFEIATSSRKIATGSLTVVAA